jgi:fatty-acyl-CoA synthase
MIDMGAAEICQLYGLTETYGNCTVVDGLNDPLEKRLTTCGRPLPGAVMRIVDPETNTQKAIGEVGEIQVLTPVTPGYYKDEDKNREAFLDDGYFRTGDLGRIDEDGYLVFEGRLKDMIKVGGINVSPAEVESVLMENAAIAAAYVVAVPDKIRGEIVGAVVIPNNRSADSEALEAAMRSRMKADLSAYKRPSRYLFVSEAELPLTTTGKLKRNELFRLFD